jgi:aspartyl-tRNA synthetase
MISRVLSADLPEHIGKRVTIAGWLHRRRELKSVTFLIVRDRSGVAQVVLPPLAPDLPELSCRARRRYCKSKAWSSPTRRRQAVPS